MKPLQTDAAAQSVVMARLARNAMAQSADPSAKAATAYGEASPDTKAEPAAAPDVTPAAHAPQPEPPSGWTFERRRQNIPRTTLIQDAEIL